ncbi:kinase-like domain-containing protein [Rhizophagus diaphanus]|nr:kinase-like domain-containing protein [Rhizophagus diaphanus] [Rhizophagus sp. MUCL 43196]
MPKEKKWARWGTELVALKCLYGGISDFMHELKILHQYLKFNPNGFECYGVTQDPHTHKYFIVTDYYRKGDLRHYFRNLNWSKKLDMLLQLARDLRNIHNADLVHKDLHSGNVLVDTITCISDLGQSQDVRTLQTSNQVPSERICDGLRPKPIEGTPPCYIELMQQCWNSDPKKRPTAEYIANTLQGWFEGSNENISNQFKTADEFNLVNPVRENSQSVHKSAIYTSRLLPTIPIINNYSTRQFDFILPEN